MIESVANSLAKIGGITPDAGASQSTGAAPSTSFADVLKLSKQHKVNMRTAAYMLSISRVATVHRLRGIYA